MKKISFLCMLLLVFSCLLLAGCGGGSQQAASSDQMPSFKDDIGREVVLEKKPERVVVLSASFLEPFHEVGGEVVGRPDSKTFMPDYAKDLPSVGQVYQIDVEKVIALDPDMVIINKGMNEKLVKSFEDNGINCAVMDMKNYDSVRNELKVFGLISGHPELADKKIAEMDEAIEAVKSKLPKDKKRVAILHSTVQGLTVQLDGSIAGSISNMLGWENVASGMTSLDKNPDAAPYSLETLVQQNPDILFITSMGSIDTIKKNMEAEMAGNPAWNAIPAVTNGKVYYLPQNLFLLSPGIHYPEAVEYMAKLIYPEI